MFHIIKLIGTNIFGKMVGLNSLQNPYSLCAPFNVRVCVNIALVVVKNELEPEDNDDDLGFGLFD